MASRVRGRAHPGDARDVSGERPRIRANAQRIREPERLVARDLGVACVLEIDHALDDRLNCTDRFVCSV